MSQTHIAFVGVVAGWIAMGAAGCGGSSSVELGDPHGEDASSVAGNGGSGGSDMTGSSGSSETGGSSSGASGAGGTSSGAGGRASLDASTEAGGKGGAPGTDGGATCEDLVTAYGAALVEAKRCSPVAASPQCQATAPSSLPCPGCTTRVQDATKLDEIRARWASANCKRALCPAIACILPGEPRCIATDGGGGVCGSSGLVR